MANEYSAQKTLAELEEGGWERSDFPIACEDCLGTNPYVRMSKATFDRACKLCDRPFTVFRWRTNGKPQKTEICASCSKVKNLCQSCLLDLEFGLPAEVRDAGLEAMGGSQAAPTNAANREWFQQVQEQQMKAGETPWGRQGVANVVDALGELAPQYAANRGRVCAFFQRGQCAKGEHCPYVHERITADSLQQQEAARRQAQEARLAPPADQTVRTLYVGGLRSHAKITAAELQAAFERHGGPVDTVRVVDAKHCAFVCFKERAGAEQAVRHYSEHGIKVREFSLRVAWGVAPQKRAPPAAGRANGAHGSNLFYEPAAGGATGPPGTPFAAPPGAPFNQAPSSTAQMAPPAAPVRSGAQGGAPAAGAAAPLAAAQPAVQPPPVSSGGGGGGGRRFVPPPPPGAQAPRATSGGGRGPPPPPGQGPISYPSQDSRALSGKRKLVALE